MARSSSLITALQRRLGDTAFERLRGFLRREWFLSLLILLYLVLIIVDPSIVRRTPDLVDWRSLSVITALILTSKGLELSGVFSKLAPRLIEKAGGSERKLLIYLLMGVMLSSSIIMNDTAMLVFIPLVVATSRLAEMDTSRAVTLAAIAANVGSALTPIGNPQNVIIWREYALSFWSFVLSMLPFVVCWFVLLLLFAASKGGKVSVTSVPSVTLNRRLLVLSSVLLILNVSLAEIGLEYWALLITLLSLALLGREALLSFDWALVLIFAMIFVDFGGLASLLHRVGVGFPSSGLRLLLVSAGLSQLISNVPTTVLLSGGNASWLPLAVGVNVGGNGVIVGSLANLIAIRISKTNVREFHRYSIPYFLVALVSALLILLVT